MSKAGVTEVYVIQRRWRTEGRPDEWIDYRQQPSDLERARELLEFASQMSGFEGPWRIIHRVTTVVETTVD